MKHANDSHARAEAFLQIASQFRLGELPTEQPHPLTGNLSQLAQSDVAEGLRVLHAIDTQALQVLGMHLDDIRHMAQAIRSTLDSGRRVFLCGCGATGRLSIACEVLWRAAHEHDSLLDRVVAFMAGGDVALISSIEQFEDHPDYGARQLVELGFTDGDLLISCTEGGETPFVIGATLQGADISSVQPFFLYCNPDDILCRVAQRSARVIADSRIRKVNLTVGPMALAGSTRMQASTVLMAAVGAALLRHGQPESIADELKRLTTYWQDRDPAAMKPFVVTEAECYRRGEHILYQATNDYAVSILTDTTERSPTFSMQPFENVLDPRGAHSMCYLYMPEATESLEAWHLLLRRQPRTLEWPEIGDIASLRRLRGFDFGAGVPARRGALHGGTIHHSFVVAPTPEHMVLHLGAYTQSLPIAGLSSLSQHLILKMLLNAHSTLVMGRLGRYTGNIMTWVKPSNNKLIDRAIRYVEMLLERNGTAVPYDRIARTCFEIMESIGPDQSLVHAVIDRL